MKHFIIFLFAVFIVQNLVSQEYEQLVDTSKMWVEWIGCSANPETGRTEAYKFANPKKIDGKQWYNIYYADDAEYADWSPWYYGVSCRESDRKVYCLINDTTYVMYDYSVSVGDTITFANNPNKYVIDQIDTTFFAGKERAAFHYSNSRYSSGTYYEGVGHSHGLLIPITMQLIGSEYRFVCFFDAGELLYHNSEFESCYKNTMSINTLDKNQIQLMPNPASDRITIIAETIAKPETVEIYDMQGQLVFQRNGLKNQWPLHLPVHNLSDGVYMLILRNQNQVIGTRRFMKYE